MLYINPFLGFMALPAGTPYIFCGDRVASRGMVGWWAVMDWMHGRTRFQLNGLALDLQKEVR